MKISPRRTTLASLASIALLATACGGSGSVENTLDEPALSIYSGRSEELVKPVLDAFECESGIQVRTNFGKPADLALQLVEEGDRSPADVFLSKSPGVVGFLRNEGLLTSLGSDVTTLVDDANVGGDSNWVGITGRQRVLVYNVDLVDEADLPDSVLDLTDPKYAGKVAIPATNGSFQDWFTVFRAQEGDDVAEQWLADMVANDAIVTESNRPTVDAVGRGEYEFGLVNHYYNFQEAEALGDAHRAQNHSFASDDIGSLVIVTAGAVTSISDNPSAGEQLLAFMLSDGAQTFFTNDSLEYPLADGVEPADVLPPLGNDGSDFDVTFDELGDGLSGTVKIIETSGILASS